MKDSFGALLASRKTMIALGAIATSGAVMIAGMVLKADKEYVLAMVATVGALAFRQIGAIGTEDAAKHLANGEKESNE